MSAQEKPCPPTGVTTDPDEPVNTLHPDYTNDFFDWTNELYEVYFLGGSIQTQANPYTANNGGVTNLYQTGDYKPEDGWQLIYVDFGYDIDGNLLPSPVRSGQLFFVLYNKYRSILRVFVAIDELDQNNLTEIELSMDGDYNTALLAATSKVQQPLKSFDPSVVVTNIQKFTNGSVDTKNWHYADFPVNYDPCTCEAPSQKPSGNSLLLFNVNLVDQSSIELHGFSNGTIENIVDKDDATSSSSASWDDFYGTVKKAGQLIETGRKGFKTFDVFKQDAKATANGKDAQSKMEPGIDNLGSFLVENNKALKFLPYASEALAIIDFFIGGTKQSESGPQKVLLPPMSIQLEHTFKGTITSSYNYIRKPIFTPGSSFSPSNEYSFGDDRYPIYNEVLGLYTILKKPEIDLWTGFVSRDFEVLQLARDIYYPIEKRATHRRIITIDDNSLKIAINEASDMTLKDAYIQFVYTMDNTGVFFGSNSDAIIVNDTTCVSPLVPLSCANSRAFAIDVVQEREIGLNVSTTPAFPELSGDNVRIQLILDFENAEGNRFLHKATWHTETNEIDNYGAEGEVVENFEIHNYPKRITYDWFNNQWLEALNFGFFNADENLNFQNETIESDKSASATIGIANSTVQSNLQMPENNGYTNLIAGEWIEVLPDSEIKPNSILEISNVGMNCNSAYTQEASNIDISNICEGYDYQNQKYFNKKSMKNTRDLPQSLRSIEVYPNPADDFIKVSLLNGSLLPEGLELSVLDMTGSVIINKQLTTKAEFVEIKTSYLSPGVYLIQATSKDLKTTKYFIIK